jgi:hypothetical protein
VPTKRRSLHRHWRPGRFSPEAVELFVELEDAPQDSPRFKEKSRELARMLGLGNEWLCSCVHVNDRSREPPHSPGYPARDDWFRVHAVRTLLLEATKDRSNVALAPRTSNVELGVGKIFNENNP